MPQSSQQKPNDDNVPRESWRKEELTNGEEVGNARNRQGTRKDGPPILPKLREQMNSDTSRIVPSP